MNRLYTVVFLLVATKASASGLAGIKGVGSGASKTASKGAVGAASAGRVAAKGGKSVLSSGTTLKTKPLAGGKLTGKSTVAKANSNANSSLVNTRSSNGAMTTTYGPRGFRQTVVRQPGNALAVTNRAGHGYLQRSYGFHGQEIVHRTYFSNGVIHANIYRPVMVRGVVLNAYVPSRYYPAAFYGWAYVSWNRPIGFNFGFTSLPSFRMNANYFSPSQSYGNASSWLTDDVIASSLQDAFAEQADGGEAQTAADSGSAPITPAVKQAVAQEVQEQIVQENAQTLSGTDLMPDASAASVAATLSDGAAHVFVVSSSLTVPSTMGDCVITGGDVLQMNGSTDQGNLVSLVVLASKDQDCQRNNTVFVQISDLQEMLNHMREAIDAGLADLQSRLGQGAFPNVPAAAMNPAAQPAYAAIPVDTNVASVLGQEAQQAQQAEQDVTAQNTGNKTNEQTQPAPSKGARVGHVLGNMLAVGATVADYAVK